MQEIFDFFLSSITEPSFAKYSDEELDQVLKMYLRRSISKFTSIEPIEINYEDKTLSRKLTDLEIEVIIAGMLSAHLDQKLHKETLLTQAIIIKNYKSYSNANMILSLSALKKAADSNFYYLMNKYELNKMMGENNNGK